MKKLKALLNETFYLIREHKLYFLSPILILLALLAVLFFHFGPGVILTFIYAGV